MIAAFPKDRFLESLERCRAFDGFLTEFYHRLLASDPEIRRRFRYTNMKRQARMLSESLALCASAVAGEPEGLAKLSEIGVSHDRYHRNIRPEWYETWLETMVVTASHYDPEWCEEVEAAWRSTLSLVIQRIASRYEGD